MTNPDAIHDQDDRARHDRIKAPRPYRFGAKRPIEGLPAALPDPVKAYLDVLPEGRVVGFPLAPLDRTGVPVWFVALFLDDPFFVGAMPSGIGYGATDEEALIGAVAEIAENLMPSLAVLPRAKERASYTDLARVYGAASVADPLTLCLPAGSPVGRDTVLEWTPTVRHATGEIVLMPLDVAATDYFELSEGYKPFTNLITNGLGAGPDVPFALGHGVLELLQRDGNGLRFRAMDEGVVLDLGRHDEAVRDPAALEALKRLRHQGIEPIVKLASLSNGVVNLYVVGSEPEPPQPIMVTAAGEAAHPDRDIALRKALLEFAAARSRKAFMHGPLDRVARIAPDGYLDRFTSDPAVQEPRALREMVQWLRLGPDQLRAQLADSVLARRSTVAFADLPTAEDARDPAGLCRRLVSGLTAAGFDILVLAVASGGAVAVKVVVPGLEVETMSYGRIGERGVADLLARGDGRLGLHGIVGLTDPPGTAVPVLLPPGAEDRLGGRPWLDRAAIDRVIGPLYPLYREPGRHSAPAALARGMAL